MALSEHEMQDAIGLFEGLKVGASVLRIGAPVGGFVTVVVSQVPHVCLQATEYAPARNTAQLHKHQKCVSIIEGDADGTKQI